MKWGIFFGIALVSCVPPAPARGVRQSDVLAWQQVPVIELETHTLFSTIPMRKTQLSDGAEMWDYANCRTYQENVNCTSSRGAFGTVNTNCSGGGTGSTCCHNQFTVRAGVVEAYRPTGRCYTDCSTRPGGRCKRPDEVQVSADAVGAAGSAKPAEAEVRDPATVAILQAPRVPELGATLVEVRTLCDQQRGTFVNRSSTVGCKLRGRTLFACTLDPDSRADRCDGFYESADFGASRRSVEAKLGPAARESVSADGFRVFEWANGGETVSVTMYAKGVRMTHARLPSDSSGLPAP